MELSKKPRLQTCKLINFFVVAECSLCCRRSFVKNFGDMRSKNAGMSNDYFCLKQNHRKSKVFSVEVKLQDGVSQSLRLKL